MDLEKEGEKRVGGRKGHDEDEQVVISGLAVVMGEGKKGGRERDRRSKLISLSPSKRLPSLFLAFYSSDLSGPRTVTK